MFSELEAAPLPDGLAQDPLLHLRQHDPDERDTDADKPLDALLPVQPLSIHDTRVRLTFPPHPSSSSPPFVLDLAVDAGPGCGGITWPAGEVLARYLASRKSPSLAGANVIELGSGTGLVGLVVGMLGARVWITDQSPLLPTMTRNIALNASCGFSVTATELNWGEPLPEGLPKAFDAVLAADCVYFEPAFPLLVKTLCDLIPPDRTAPTEALFCYKKRRKADRRFFALLKKHFTWHEVDDDPDRETYAREAITLLRLHRKPVPSSI